MIVRIVLISTRELSENREIYWKITHEINRGEAKASSYVSTKRINQKARQAAIAASEKGSNTIEMLDQGEAIRKD